MSKYKEVISCFDCDNCNIVSGEVIRCISLNSVINTFDGIPKECPLPDLPDIGALQAELDKLKLIKLKNVAALSCVCSSTKTAQAFLNKTPYDIDYLFKTINLVAGIAEEALNESKGEV